MKVLTVKGGYDDNLTYIIVSDSGNALVVDPIEQVDRILNEAEGLKIKYVVNTHSHFDHTGGNRELLEKTGAKLIVHKDFPGDADKHVDDGNVISLDELKIKVISTPGHIPDAICLLVKGKLFTGDTLFVGGCGRTDFAGGNIDDQYESLKKLSKLPDDTVVYPGHDYGDKEVSTIGEEKKTNRFLGCSKEEFMNERMG